MRLIDHIGKLEYFSIIAESQSLSAATGRALISQPQLTKIIQQLEEILETPLVTRTTRGIQLTPEGELLYKKTKKILKQVQEIEDSLKHNPAPLKGTVKIGCYSSIARYFFPDFLKMTSERQPMLNYSLLTAKSLQLFKKLKQGEIDLAVLVNTGNLKSRYIQEITLYRDFFSLYAAPLLKNSFQKNLIFYNFEANNVDQSARRFGFNKYIECETIDNVKSLTEEGLGIGLLPGKVARDGVLKNKLEQFSHKKIKTREFDHHSIILCYDSRNNSEELSYTHSEIQRYMKLWVK